MGGNFGWDLAQRFPPSLSPPPLPRGQALFSPSLPASEPACRLDSRLLGLALTLFFQTVWSSLPPGSAAWETT